jgi:signal transduction histidine kinase
MRPHHWTTLAAILIGMAVVLPTAAWYVTGSREAARRAAAVEADAERKLRDDVEREASRLGARLEALRLQESERPFFHYKTLYRDPRGAAEGLAVTPSPLISGSTDPLVWAHFQIDENGLVTLPAVSERFPELSSDANFGAFCSLLEELQSAIVMDEAGGPGATADDEQLHTMTGFQWEQIALADTVYATITGRPDDGSGRSPDLRDLGPVVIRVRPLRWHTLVLGSGPALGALREVFTPAGVVLQGFAVAPQAVAQWLGASTLSVRFTPGSLPSSDGVTAAVGNTGWNLELDSPGWTTSAAADARAIVTQFRRAFAFAGTAVLLAAAAVILILFQTDRLARQRARFAAAAAHELRTPLSGLMLHAELLAANLGDSAHRSKYAETVSAEARRLGRVVGNMLDLARLERGTTLATPHEGNLGTAVHDCVARQRSRLADAGLVVDLAVSDDLPPAVFDGDALNQILDNLLDNAEKHTRAVANRSVTVTVDADHDVLRVTVHDNGPGIPRGQRRALFRPFDRAEDAAGRPGLGLGLAVARSLAHAQNGELELDAANPHGATFVLTLPRAAV